MRHRAWRAERATRHGAPNVDPSAIHTVADLPAVASSAERCLGAYLSALTESHPDQKPSDLVLSEP